MTTKPPFGLAASGRPDGSDHDVEDLSDQIVVDSSQDVTVEASEESTLEIEDEGTANETPPPTPAPLFGAGSMVTPPPTTTGAVAQRGAPTLLGMVFPSMPLPGSSSASRASKLSASDDDDDSDPDVGEDDDEVTVMARPSVTDDEEEATKVEPTETAIRAAASKEDDDELSAALSTQATLERERALRKSFPPSLDVPLSAHSYRAGEPSGAEFSDPSSSDDAISLSGETPGVVSVQDDDGSEDDDRATNTYATQSESDEEEPLSELEAVLAPRRPAAPLGGSPFGGPPFSAAAPLSRADGGFGGRLPTPSSGLGLTLPPSPSSPPPAVSPFSARVAPTGAPYPRTISPAPTGPTPALQIPAPSGAVTVASSTGGIYRKVQMPLVVIAASCVGCLVFGLVIGKSLGTRTASAPVVVAAPVAAPIPPPAAAEPAHPAVAAAPPPAAAPAPTPPPAAAPATPPPVAAAAPTPTPPPAAAPAPSSSESATTAAPHPAVKHVAARPVVKRVATSTGTAPAPKPARAAKSTAAKG